MTDKPSNEMTPLAKLRSVLGYLEDASAISVTIWQDAGTEEFILRKNTPFGQWDRKFRSGSLKGVIDKAFIDEVSP